MMDKILFGARPLVATKQALDAYAERGRVHARNVANAETPGYRAQEVRFEDDLKLALRTNTEGQMARTQEAHMPAIGSMPQGRVVPQHGKDAWTGNGINDVEIDREMAEIARNTERYTVAAEMVKRTYDGLRKSIYGRPTY